MIRWMTLVAAMVVPPAVLAQSDAALNAGDVIKDCEDCPELVVIPSGTFMMGTPISDREVDLSRGDRKSVV